MVASGLKTKPEATRARMKCIVLVVSIGRECCGSRKGSLRMAGTESREASSAPQYLSVSDSCVTCVML